MASKYLMLDIETSSIDPSKGEILQIGLLECILDKSGYYTPARSMEKTLYFDPEFDQATLDPWIRNTHKELLPKCTTTSFQSAPEVRAELINFFQRCNGTNDTYLMGLNASAFDLPWLYAKGYLKPGDAHYRTYELSGAYALAQTVMNYDRRTFFKNAENSCEWITMPQGTEHTSLYDCYKQLKTLNGCIKMLRVGVM
jgi:hypothetical protein